MERRGKSSPVSAVTQRRCKPYPKQHRSRIVCPTYIRRVARGNPKLIGDGKRRLMTVHDRTRLTDEVKKEWIKQFSC